MKNISNKITRIATSTPNLNLENLLDVSAATASNGQALVFNSGVWSNQNVVNSFKTRTGNVVPASGDYALAQMSDCSISGPATNQLLQYNGTDWINSTVSTGLTSVGLSMPNSTFSVSGSPLTSNGTITVSYEIQSQNQVLASLASGSGQPSFRSLQAVDIPALAYVTSVGLTMPSEFSISGSPITSSGTLAVTKTTQLQNLVYAAPNGSTGVPIFRSLVSADIPTLAYLTSFNSRTGPAILPASGDYSIAQITNSSVLASSINCGITSPTIGQFIRYVGGSGPVWVNENIQAADVPTLAYLTSFNSRTGPAILPAANDYAITQISGVSISSPATNQVLKYNGTNWTNQAEAVTSVFTRTGAVTPASGDYTIAQITNSSVLASTANVTITSPSTNQVLQYNGSVWVNNTISAGGLTSVGLSMPNSTFNVSGSPLTANGTITVSYATQSPNQVLASLVSGSGVPSFRSLQAADIPTLAYLTSFNSRTGPAITPAANDYAITQLSGVSITSPSSGQVLTYNGTNWANATEYGVYTSLVTQTSTSYTLTANSINNITSCSVTMPAGVAGQFIMVIVNGITSSWVIFPSSINFVYNNALYSNFQMGSNTGTACYYCPQASYWWPVSLNGLWGNTAISSPMCSSPLAIENLVDVVAPSPTNNQILAFNSGSDTWVNVSNLSSYYSRTSVTTGTTVMSTGGGIYYAANGPCTLNLPSYSSAANPGDSFKVIIGATGVTITVGIVATTSYLEYQGTYLTGPITLTSSSSYGSIVFEVVNVNYGPGILWYTITNTTGIWQPSWQTPRYGDNLGVKDASDTAISSPATNQVLKYNGTSWANQAEAVTSVFTRTGAVTASSGDYTIAQITNASTLASTSNVTITSPATNQLLRYNGTVWVNANNIKSETFTAAAALTASNYIGTANTSTTISACEIMMSNACTMAVLSVKLSAAPTSTNTRVFTVYQNGSATAMAVTITGAATTGLYNTTPLTISQYDLITIYHTTSGTPTASYGFITIDYYL